MWEEEAKKIIKDRGRSRTAPDSIMFLCTQQEKTLQNRIIFSDDPFVDSLFFIFHFSSICFHSLKFFSPSPLHMEDSSCPSKVERSKFPLKSNPYLKNKRKWFFSIRNKTFRRCRSLTCSDF